MIKNYVVDQSESHTWLAMPALSLADGLVSPKEECSLAGCRGLDIYHEFRCWCIADYCSGFTINCDRAFTENAWELVSLMCYSSRKKSSSTFFKYRLSSIRTPTLCRIIKVASCSPSISTIRKGWRSAKLLAGWVKYEFVTNTPLLAFTAPRLPLNALISGSLTALSTAYRFAWT